MERGQGNSKKETDVEGKKKNTDRECKTQSLQVLLETLIHANKTRPKYVSLCLQAEFSTRMKNVALELQIIKRIILLLESPES